MTTANEKETVVTAAQKAGKGPGSVAGLTRYRLIRRLGSGSFGSVWTADDQTLHRQVAVKLIAADTVERERFEREAKAAARINHPAVVSIYEAGSEGDYFYLVSELVEGRPLAELISTRELSDLKSVQIGLALCEALAHVHRCGVVHRDLKPQNVIVPAHRFEGSPPVKLTDFGIAQLAGEENLTQTGEIVGTLAYMAPEQAEGEQVTEASDLYSLALVVYEMLTGTNPLRGGGPAATARRIGSKLTPIASLRGDLPTELCWAVDRALDPNPHSRGVVSDLAAALHRSLPAVTDHVPPDFKRTPLTGQQPIQEVLPPRLDYHQDGEVAQKPEASDVEAGRGTRAKRRWTRLFAASTAAAMSGGVGLLPGFPPLSLPLLATGIAVLVGLLPRAGWLVSAATLTGAAAVWSSSGTAVLVALMLFSCPLLLWRRWWLWSLPAAAPGLGAMGVAPLFVAVLASVRGVYWRAALALLGFWWLALAEYTWVDRLYAGPLVTESTDIVGTAGNWDSALSELVGPLLVSGPLLLAAGWVSVAVLLPATVRPGGPLRVRLALATVWAGIFVASQLLAGETVAAAFVSGSAQGLVLGSVLTAGAALLRTSIVGRRHIA